MNDTPVPSPQYPSPRQVALITVGVLTGVLLSALDQTVVGTALPRIVGDIGGLSKLAWVVTGYLITSMAATPLWGKFSDLYGRRPMFQATITIFIVGSALCGVSQNITELVLFRGLQGVGAGGLYALALAIIGDVVPPAARGRYQGYFMIVYGIASVGGPLVGGWLTDGPGWRWIFYINVPLGLASLAVTVVALKLKSTRRSHTVDYPGAVLIVGSVTSLLLYLNWSATRYGWGAPVSLGLLAAFVVLTALLVLVESRAGEPIIPLGLFANRVYGIGTVFSFMTGAAMFAGVVYLPVYLQSVMGFSPVKAGLAMLPAMIGIGVSSTLSGIMMSKTGKFKIYPVAGSAMVAVSLGLMVMFEADTSYWQVAAVGVVFGLGVGATMQTIITAVQNSVQPKDIGTATSSTNFFQRMGAAVGTAVFGAVLTSRLSAHLAHEAPGSAASGIDVNKVKLIAHLQQPLKGHVVGAFAHAFDDVFLVSVPFAVVAFGVALFLRDSPRPAAPTVPATEAAAATEVA
ncbi:MAG: MFS transporter [Catenulispora sp.]|nr:MFS transporter [Catenulispora sp.]